MPGRTFRSSSAAAIVTTLKVEPGSNVSVTGRLRSSAGLIVARRLGLKRGTVAIASIAPLRGSMTMPVALRAPYCSRVAASVRSTRSWIVGSMVSWTFSPVTGSRSSSIWIELPSRSRTSTRWPGVPVSGWSSSRSMPEMPSWVSPVRPMSCDACGPPG